MMGKKWIGYGRLLEEVPSTSSDVYKFPKRAERSLVPRSPSGPQSTVYTYFHIISHC